jgi:predicted permease
MIFAQVFVGVLLPIAVMFMLGWWIDRRFRLDLATLVKLNIHVVVPAFIFYEVVSSDLHSALAWRVVIFTFITIAGMGVISFWVGRLAGYPREQTRALQLATMFYNSGNYGIPLMALAFPGIGPILQVFVVITQNVSTFTIGLFLANSARRGGWHAAVPMLRQVSLWAVGSAFLVRWLGLPVMSWPWLWTPVTYLHAALVGIALITLGAQLSQTRARQNAGRLSWAVGLRLLGGPLLACALAPLFGFRGEIARIMVVSTGFPTAVNTALIAHECDADPEFAAAAVFYSTLASMITVTALVTFSRMSLPFPLQ